MALVLIIASQFFDIFWSQINHALWKTRPSDPKLEELATLPQTQDKLLDGEKNLSSNLILYRLAGKVYSFFQRFYRLTMSKYYETAKIGGLTEKKFSYSLIKRLKE